MADPPRGQQCHPRGEECHPPPLGLAFLCNHELAVAHAQASLRSPEPSVTELREALDPLESSG
eukprot:12966031-Alexandrium_andersonii.AAC.1